MKIIVNKMRAFRLRLDVDKIFVNADLPGQPIGPIFKG